MALRKPVYAGNWKMHHDPRAAAEFFADFLPRARGVDGSIVFFPPAVSLAAAREAVSQRPDVLLGVQNIHWEAKGAFTGEVSAPLAAAAGARLVLVGHSERRQLFGETSEEAARKVRSALDAGLLPVLCVGETLEQREAGEAEAVVIEQLEPVVHGLGPGQADRLLIAYEPVWAIGTGRTASPRDAAEMHGRIRAFLRRRLGDASATGIPILYGGSVKPDNAAALLAEPDVDGVLVGGASLEPAGFARICGASA